VFTSLRYNKYNKEKDGNWPGDVHFDLNSDDNLKFKELSLRSTINEVFLTL
jgi:hypothetical protein